MTDSEKKWTVLGDPAARLLFVQPVDAHHKELLGSQAAALAEYVGDANWCMAAVDVDDWNRELAPWKAGPVFGKQGFGDGAARTLDHLLSSVLPSLEPTAPGQTRPVVLCGYSLAGLFALWSAYQTDVFAGIVAASPSVWYRDWLDYARSRPIRASRVYLSLGDREEKTRSAVMATVGTAIREQHRLLCESGVRCQMDWNPGNHFADSDRRMAKGMAWMLQVLKEENAL